MGMCVVLHCSYVSRESSNTLYNLHIIHWALFFFILNLDGLFVYQSPCQSATHVSIPFVVVHANDNV